MFYYLALIILGLINAYLSGLLYIFLGSLLFREGFLVLLASPIYLYSISIPLLYLLFLLVEIPVAVLFSSFLLKKIKKMEQRLLSSFLISIIIFVILQILFFIVPAFFNQTAEKNENPVESGIKQYNFLEKNIFNNRQSAKNNLKIEGSNIVWIEQTKEFPTYPKNIWNIFIFSFDAKNSQGEINQISDFDNAKKGSPESLEIFDGKIYWTQDTDLYEYNPYLKTKELISKNIGIIYGKYKNLLIYKKGFNPNPYGSEKIGLFAYDLSNNKEIDLTSKIGDINKLTVRDKYICFSTVKTPGSGKNTVVRYNLDTDETDILDTWLEDVQLTWGFQILDCSDKYIAYEFGSPTSPGKPSPTELRVYQFGYGEVLVKRLESFNLNGVKGKLIKDNFYYSDKGKIFVTDLYSSNEDLVVGEIGSTEWDVSDEYITYQKGNDLYIQPLSD